MNMQHSHTTDGAGLTVSFGPNETERDQMERRGTRRSGEGFDGTDKNQIERRGQRDQMERIGAR